MTESDLRAASWWARHGLALRRLGYGSLVAVSVALWGFTLWTYLDTYVISWPRESRIQKLIAQQMIPQDIIRRVAPEALQPGDVSTFETTDSRLDALGSITNPNTLWSAHVTYAFKLGEQTSDVQQATILPRSTRPLIALGLRGNGDVQLDVQSIVWQRIKQADINNDYDSFAAARQDFVLSENPTYVSVGDGVGKTDFTLTNNTAFGYWNVELYVSLLRQGIPLAVNKIDVRELKPNEVRPISLQWLEEVAGVDQVDIVPYVDILDKASYLPTDRL